MTDSAPPAVASPTDQAVLYRAAALEHRRLGGVDMRPSDVAPPWAWAVTIGIAASLFVAGLFVAFADVELSTQGRAILYPGTGVRTVRSEVPAVATEVATEPGKTVTSGEILIYLASAESEAAVSERQSELTILQRDRSQFTAIEQRSYNAQWNAIEQRIRQTETRRASLMRSLETRRARVDANDRLAAAGLAGSLSVQESHDALEEIQRELSVSDSAAQQLRQELSALEHQHLDALREHGREVDMATARRRELDYVGSRNVIRAPSAGVVDEVLVRSGDFIPPHTPVVRVIPEHTPFRLIALLPQEKRSSVKEGEIAAVALDEYPSQVYGTLSARVTHIAGDIAAAADLPSALASDAGTPSFRVELELLQPPPSMTMHSGMLATVRFKLPHQRLFTILEATIRGPAAGKQRR